MEAREPKNNTRNKVMNWIADWYMDLITRRLLIACLFFILGLTFIHGGPLTINISDQYSFTLLSESFEGNNLTGKVLIILGFAELIDMDIVVMVIHKVLDPILKPILTPIFTHPKVKSALTYISSKLPKEKDDDTGDNDKSQML